MIKRKKFIKKIASEQIEILFGEAKQKINSLPDKSQRYIELARAISKRCKVPIPRLHKFQICNHCKSYLHPGVNCQVRIRTNKAPHITITCFNCKRYSRYYLKKRRGKVESTKREIG